MLQHLKFASRFLRKNLSLTLIAAGTLALGIGATTAVFTMVDAVLLRPLAYRDPSQLVSLNANEPGAGGRNLAFNPVELDDLRDRGGIFDQVSAIWPVSANVTGGDHPERIELLAASPSYFSILGVSPQLGRVFGPEDEALGFADACVISDAAWHRMFGGNPSVLGHRIYIDTDGYTIVGVMPSGFRHPGNTVVADVDVWVTAGYKADPFPHPPKREQRFIPGAIARLKSGVTAATAQARLNTLVSQLRQDYPNVYPTASKWTIDLTSLDETVVGKSRSILWILLGAVAAILLIGCINVANLLLSRASSREREIAVRLALGARRSDLIAQLLTESFVLSLLATAAGSIIGWVALRAMVILGSSKLPRLNEIRMNTDVLLFVIALAALTTILFGLVPALQSSSPSLITTLGGARGGGGSRRQNRMREGLVVAEVGMSLVLLAGAGLLGRTLLRLINVDAGFNPAHVEVARIWLPVPNHPELDPYRKPPERIALFREMMRRISAIPAVESAGLTGSLPLTAEQFVNKVGIEGVSIDPRSAPDLPQLIVNPGYFQALQIALRSGREFTEDDDVTHDPVVIVDEAAAKQFWKGNDAVGKRVALLGGPQLRWFTIVGVVGDVKQSGLDSSTSPHIYFSIYQGGPRTLSVVARLKPGISGNETTALAEVGEQIRQQIQAVNKDLPVFGIQPMTNLVSSSLTARRFSAQVIGAFSLLALILAAIGVYGVISYWVAQRTRELGIRMAIGAQPADVLKLVLVHGMRLAAIGVGCGIVATAATAPLLRSQLYGISTFDPIVLLGGPIVLLSVACAAAYRPAVRAMRVDPIVALREE